MKIKKEVFEQISIIANREICETGGILGSSESEIVTDIVPDLHDKTQASRFEYHPNILFLNEEIKKWSQQNIEFLGMFHIHFIGSCNLSQADICYIESIMNSLKGEVEFLYFPIYVLPCNELYVYKAYFKKDEIIICKDELEFV